MKTLPKKIVDIGIQKTHILSVVSNISVVIRDFSVTMNTLLNNICSHCCTIISLRNCKMRHTSCVHRKKIKPPPKIHFVTHKKKNKLDAFGNVNQSEGKIYGNGSKKHTKVFQKHLGRTKF